MDWDWYIVHAIWLWSINVVDMQFVFTKLDNANLFHSYLMWTQG